MPITTTMRVPHNWFGQGKYVAPAAEIANGKEECDVCKLMIQNQKQKALKAQRFDLAPGEKDLCFNVSSPYQEMCRGYQHYLKDCPSFKHNICHEDVGGSERLRAPCTFFFHTSWTILLFTRSPEVTCRKIICKEIVRYKLFYTLIYRSLTLETLLTLLFTHELVKG
eukprot:GSMAST32.ASY1.ANO1.2797.1 assembled CDS